MKLKQWAILKWTAVLGSLIFCLAASGCSRILIKKEPEDPYQEKLRHMAIPQDPSAQSVFQNEYLRSRESEFSPEKS